MGFMFEVGKTYKTQDGQDVTVLGRSEDYRGYETLICSDNRFRYDRSTNSTDAGRVTATNHDYSCPLNLSRDDYPYDPNKNRIDSESMQMLLDLEATFYSSSLLEERASIEAIIKKHRGSKPPVCWGDDDCSSSVLVKCPWRIDCDKSC